jgi:hypothetical protein
METIQEYTWTFRGFPQATNATPGDTKPHLFAFWNDESDLDSVTLTRLSSNSKYESQATQFPDDEGLVFSRWSRATHNETHGCTKVRGAPNGTAFVLKSEESVHGQTDVVQIFVFSSKDRAVDHVEATYRDFVANRCGLCGPFPRPDVNSETASLLKKFTDDSEITFGECMRDYSFKLTTTHISAD